MTGFLQRWLIVFPGLCLIGCADSADVAPTTTTPETQRTTGEVSVATPDTSAVAPAAPQESVAAANDMEFAPLNVGSTDSATPSSSSAASGGQSLTGEARLQSIMQKLKPLQVMLGNWRGTTRKEYDGFKAVDNHEWIWDLKSNPQQPALVAQSDKSPYLKRASITWNPDLTKFVLTSTDGDDVIREFVGDYTDPVHEIVGPDDKLHRVFRLQLTQTDESFQKTGGEIWQMAFAQQENNRYLLEVDRRRGSADFRRYDTVSTQREGTSFALSDSDYGEKSCIISQGLGTIAVSHQGKTYWVCCSGCKAAFEDDPATWIARAAKKAAN
jgi:hypothetical protein